MIASRKSYPARREEREYKQSFRSFFWTLAIAVALALLLRMFVIETIRVEGPSMQPTLHTNERVLIEKITLPFSMPERNDIVVCQFEGQSEPFVKRVIGLPGETIEIRNGDVYINGAPLEEDTHANGKRPRDMAAVTSPEDSVFVMGDNRANSADSCVYGPIEKSRIRGIVVLRFWPLSEISTF